MMAFASDILHLLKLECLVRECRRLLCPEALLLEADQVVVSLILLALIFFLSLYLMPHWLILFRLAWAGMHLMQFYVQAV